MNEKRFDELLESVREGGRILRGEVPASRAFKVDGAKRQRGLTAAYAVILAALKRRGPTRRG